MSQASLQVHYKLDQNGSGAPSDPGSNPAFSFSRPGLQAPSQSFKFENGENSQLRSNLAQPKNQGVKRNRNLALGNHDYVSFPAKENSFELLSKNFPFLKSEEISQILKTSDQQEDNTDMLAGLRIKNAVKPFLEEQSQKFKKTNFANRAPLVRENVPQAPRVSKKRGRQNFDKGMTSMEQQENIQDFGNRETQISSCQMEDTHISSPAKVELSPEDKFFGVLESNMMNYLDNRPAAYKFVLEQLKQFKDETSLNENPGIEDHLKDLTHKNEILKKGIRIQNKKLEENDAKAKNFDQLMVAYQKLNEEKNRLQTYCSYHIRKDLPAPYMNGHQNGGHGPNGGFGGGIC